MLTDVTAALAGKEGVSNVRSPLDSDGATLVSKDGHAALVQFELADDDERATSSCRAVLDAVDRVAEHPGFRVEQFGGAGATASTRRSARTSSRPIRR